MATTSELILKFSGDSTQLRQVMAQLRTELSRFSQGQVAIDQNAIRSTQQSEQRRVAETIKSANLRLREEQRAAREVARIMAETARQAAAQERVRERAAKQLSDVQIREAKRAAKELEASLGSGGGGSSFNTSAILGITSRIPGLSGLTSELGSLSSATEAATASQASLAGPIGLVSVAAIAQATAMIKLHQELFSIAKQTADFEGRLFDMSQQVGVSVETLSTLEVLATTTGGNIESVAASLGIFQKNLEASHDPTSKEAKLLAQLGVTSSDTEEALAQTLQGLFKLGEGSRQTAAVLELFGRSGRFVNAILKESEGDLEKARAKFEALGIVVGTDAARAADQFNDNLALIDFQVRGLIALIGNELIPLITGALEESSKVLKDNKDAVEGLGLAVKIVAGFLSIQFLSALGTVDALIKTHKGEIELLKDAYESLAAAMQLVTNSVPQVPENLIPPVNLEGQKAGLTLLQDLQRLFKQSGGKGFDNKLFGRIEPPEGLLKGKDSNKALEAGVALLRQLQGELRNLTSVTKVQEVTQQLLDERYKDTNASLRQQIIAAAQLIDVTKENIEVKKKLQEDIDKETQAMLAGAASVSQFMQQQAEVLRELQFGPKSATQETEEFIAKLSLVPGAIAEIDKEWLRYRAHLIDSINRMREMLDIMREQAAVVPGPGTGTVPELNSKVVFDPDKTIGLPPPPDFSVWEDALSHLRLMLEGFSTFATTTVKFAMESLADGLGDAARAWVLYGESIGKALKRALAETLASIAAQALVQAALHAAYAIGDLAFGNFAAAAQHALAAAKFAAVAAIAGLAGRAVAGNSFSGAGSGSRAASGTSSGNSSRSTAATSSQPRPVDLDRTTRNQQAITLLVNVKQEPGAIVQVTLDDHRNNGPIRQMILSEIKG